MVIYINPINIFALWNAEGIFWIVLDTIGILNFDDKFYDIWTDSEFALLEVGFYQKR